MTRAFMTASAAVLGAGGIAGSFFPHELLRAFGTDPAGLLPVFVQALAALWLAWAMTNWAARGNAIGGIYGRPIAIGNFTHFAIVAITLVKLLAAGERTPMVVGAAAVYVVFAVGFARLLFGPPPVGVRQP